MDNAYSLQTFSTLESDSVWGQNVKQGIEAMAFLTG